MKVCPNCKAQLDDAAVFCTNCGTNVAAVGAPTPAAPPPVTPAPAAVQPPVVPPIAAQQNFGYDPNDHTSEFDPKDISDNKVFAMLCYLMDAIGVIIALLASADSPYTKFHVRQSLKFSVVELLLGICAVLLVWTIIVPIAAAIVAIVLLVIKIICFFQVCGGKAKDAAIIRSLGFLK